MKFNFSFISQGRDRLQNFPLCILLIAFLHHFKLLCYPKLYFTLPYFQFLQFICLDFEAPSSLYQTILKKSFFSVICIFIKAVGTAAETQNTLALLNDYVTACNFSVIKNTYSSTKFMLEECYPREQFHLIVCNLILLNILCIKTKVVSSGKRIPIHLSIYNNGKYSYFT